VLHYSSNAAHQPPLAKAAKTIEVINPQRENELMLNVNVAELNNDLNDLLSKVRAGLEILLHDHDRPIARLVPVNYSEDFDEELLSLASAGKARLPEESLPESFWEMPAPEIELNKIVAALRADRDEE
jgi:antitoxin (DNA-binding transcriptional repressor) of toxin-antitoxin stability system